jgi:hypothetical protein
MGFLGSFFEIFLELPPHALVTLALHFLLELAQLPLIVVRVSHRWAEPLTPTPLPQGARGFDVPLNPTLRR